MAIIYIQQGSGWVDLPDPTAMQIDLQDIDASTTTRSANGTMRRDRICGAGGAKRKIELEWAYLNTETVSEILKAIQDVFFTVKYMDPFEGAERSAEFYAGDRSLPVYHAGEDAESYIWEGLKVNLIEK